MTRQKLGVLAALGALAAAAPAQAKVEQVALVNHGLHVSPARMRKVASILTLQVDRDLRAWWSGQAVRVKVEKRDPASGPRIDLYDRLGPHATGEIAKKHPSWRLRGYHAPGPRAVVLARHCPRWTEYASHELLEMLVDPRGVRRAAGLPVEVSDPVDRDFYRLDGVWVSDFVTPAWFTRGAGAYDYLGAVSESRQVAANGYI